jgi:hypothetical protein
MERMVKEIKEAKKQADVVLVSIHSHFYDELQPNKPSQFIETFAHTCIDAGADVIIGHGPHELQGIEKYKDGLIFYSIGNYIFETETVQYQPWDAYVNQGYTPDMKVGEYMDRRSKFGTAGYGTLWEIWNAVMAAWTMEDGKITEVQLYPVTLNMEKSRSQKGRPVMNKSEKILKYLAELSAPYGTKIEIEDGNKEMYWDRMCSASPFYMHGCVTVGDCYKLYELLKGRNTSKHAYATYSTYDVTLNVDGNAIVVPVSALNESAAKRAAIQKLTERITASVTVRD